MTDAPKRQSRRRPSAASKAEERRRLAKNRVTLARALSKLGMLSRTQARTAIEAGRVTIDGRVERDPDRWIDPDRGRIEVDGRVARKQVEVWFALHKPAGVVTTRDDERGRKTVYDLLPPNLPWVFPIGRLDRDSSGLLLLTNATRLADAVSDPDSGMAKVYDVTLDGPLSHADADRMRDGMKLPDGTQLRPAQVRFPPESDRTRFQITLHEGKNRQIRRMVELCGCTVVRLHRLQIGPIRLGTMAEGELRALTGPERDALQAVGREP